MHSYFTGIEALIVKFSHENEAQITTRPLLGFSLGSYSDILAKHNLVFLSTFFFFFWQLDVHSKDIQIEKYNSLVWTNLLHPER